MNLPKDILKSIKAISAGTPAAQNYAEQKRNIILLNKDKTTLKDDIFDLGAALEGTSLQKDFFLKVKVNKDFDVEVEFLVTATVSIGDRASLFQETVVLKKKFHIKVCFSITKTITCVAENVVRKFDEKEVESSFDASKDYLINFSLKANCPRLVVSDFEFLTMDCVEELDALKSQETPFHIEDLEEANYSIIFRPTGPFRRRNIGNLNVVWNTEGSKYFSKTAFKNLLNAEAVENPFDVATKHPFQVKYMERFDYSYVFTNRASEIANFSVFLNSVENFFAAGKLHNLFSLAPGETKEFRFDVLTNRIGVVKLPDLSILFSTASADKHTKYLVRTTGNVQVDYNEEG
jgi:hypothetical protein